MIHLKKYITFLLIFFSVTLCAQQIPFTPVSYRIFNPAIFNPAVVGDKEFTTIDFNTNLSGSGKSQIVSGSTRLRKKEATEWFTNDISKFSSLGVGGYLFHTLKDSLQNFGTAASISYHLPIDREALRFISAGLSVKGLLSKKTVPAEANDSSLKNNIFSPSADIGIYYYSPHLFAGVSITNIFSDPSQKNFPEALKQVVSRQYLLTAGYKLILSEKREILLEPFFFINFGVTSFDNSSFHYHPAVRIYYKKSYFGSYLNNPDNLSFFMHLHFPQFYINSYFELPRDPNVVWKNEKLTLELSVGLNIGNKNTAHLNNIVW